MYLNHHRIAWLAPSRVIGLIGLLVLTACGGAGTVPTTQSLAALPQSSNVVPGDFVANCPYPRGDVYQSSIATATPVSNSAAYIAAIGLSNPPDGEQGDGGFQAWTGTQAINSATNATPLVTVKPGNSYETPYSPIPWAPTFFIQKDGDHHGLVVNTQSCQYYEGYKTYYYPSGNYLTMYNNEYIDLTAPFVRPPTGALSTATGIPLGLLAVRPEELTAGVIRHAIGWDAVETSINGAAGAPCVNPAGYASCTDGNIYSGPPSATPLPYGSRARLKASVDISGFSREAKIVATAMQTYGLYVYDTGCCNAIVLANDQYGTPTWTGQDATSLLNIRPDEFDIVPPPTSGQTDDDKRKKSTRG